MQRSHSRCSAPHRSVEQLDLSRVCWVPVELMRSRRSTLGVGVLNGELYAVGGFDGNNGLDSVEKYNPGEKVDVHVHCTCVYMDVHVCA